MHFGAFYVFLAWGFGLLALAFATLVGSAVLCVADRFWAIPSSFRGIAAPGLGLALTGALSFLIAADPESFLPITVVLLVVCIGILYRLGVRQVLNSFLEHRTAYVLVAVFATVQALVVFWAMHCGIEGTDVFWKIYNLTGITPGDLLFSWQQARFFVNHIPYGSVILGGGDLYDRPHFGGYLTAFFLSAVNAAIPAKLYDYPINSQFLYVGLWMWLNSLAIISIFRFLRFVASPRVAIGVTLLLMAAPETIIMSLGLWPKFLALYFFQLSLESLLCGLLPLAGIFAAAAFLAHGSMLAPCLFTLGAIVLLFVRKSPSVAHFKLAGIVLSLVCFLVPVGWWFAAAAKSGSPNPLRDYYLYNADKGALETPLSASKQTFYEQMNPKGLAVLPAVNTIKSLMPTALAEWFIHYTFSDQAPYLLILSERFLAITQSPPFALGCVLAFVAFIGLFRTARSNIYMAVSLSLGFLGPLIGFFAYRRDDIITTVGIVTCYLPLSVAIGSAMNGMTKRSRRIVTVLCAIEFFWCWYGRTRKLGPGYLPEFLIGFGLLYCAMSIAASMLFESVSKPELEEPTRVGSTGFIVGALRSKVVYAVMGTVVFAAMLVTQPLMGLILDRDLQHEIATGRPINLLEWKDVKVAFERPTTPPHLSVAVTIGAVARNVVWQNPHVEITYKGLKVGPSSKLSTFIAIHPAVVDNPSTTGAVFIVYVDEASGRREIFRRRLDPKLRTEDKGWVPVTMQIGGSVREVALTLAILPEPSGNEIGAWCLWGDPVITSKYSYK